MVAELLYMPAYLFAIGKCMGYFVIGIFVITVSVEAANLGFINDFRMINAF